jgi:hypothetical protein
MKILLTAALLLAMHLFAFSQAEQQILPGEELHLGYFRQTFKMRDQQVSPMMYIANLNGLNLSYARTTRKNYWRTAITAGMADFIAPGLGIRHFQFSENGQPLTLVPTFYKGEIALTYRRKIRDKQYRSSWVGMHLQENFHYADGIAMTTWVMNTLVLHITYQIEIKLHENHHIVAGAYFPVLGAISRLPYSNVVSRPDMTNSKAFLKNTSFSGPLKYFNPQLEVAYRLGISKRLAMQAMYSYALMRYPEPRLIRSASHTGELSFIYQWHFFQK